MVDPKALLELQRKLNSQGLVDGKWYRRNHCAYELVCYANILSGLIASGNFDNVEVFVARIREYLESGGGKHLNPAYESLVLELVEFANSCNSPVR